MDEPTDRQVMAWLNNREERPVIWLLRIHRILAILAVVLFVAWSLMAFGHYYEHYADGTFLVFAVILVASLVVKFVARRLDRRLLKRFAAMRSDEP